MKLNRIKRSLVRSIDSGFFWLVLALAMMLLWAAYARGQTTRPAAPPPGTIGVWYQPVDSFAKWKGRGVTTLIGYEAQGGAVSCDGWTKSAGDAGFNYILQSVVLDGNHGVTDAATSAHWNDTRCVAVQLSIDEPNRQNADKQFPPAVADQAKAIRARTSKPLYLNFDGNQIQWESDAEVSAYCASADWIGFDSYVVNMGNGIAAWDTAVAGQVQRLKRLATGKPIIVFVETSDQRLGEQDWTHSDGDDGTGIWLSTLMRGPTADEWTHEMATVAAWGCFPAWFPDVIGLNFESYDGTPDAIDAMMNLDAIIAHTPAAPPASQPVVEVKPSPATAPIAHAQLKLWLKLERDYKHRRILVTPASGAPYFITDPATIALLDQAAGK